MYGLSQSTARLLRLGAAFLMTAALCLSVGLPYAGAAQSQQMLVPVGHTVGVKLFSKGVLVVKQPESDTPAGECGLQTGDVILQCAGVTVTSTEQFQSLLQKSGGTATSLRVRRSGDSVSLTVEPEADDRGVYCIGAWIRDSMAGIGTMTYYDPESGTFGALGHGITDVDTAMLMPFSNGAILPSAVKAVRKGEPGAAGELRGDFDLTRDLGELYANTRCGIFGTLDDPAAISGEAIPVGTPKAGAAVIRSNVRGDAVEEFTVEIVSVPSFAADGRDMVLRVTDPALIALTGGIVQGMSGSPIIQDGKLVGAVTHVLVNDPCKGYGISIENMLEAAG